MGVETDPMDGEGETRNFGEKFRSQGITALYPYSRYNGASTNAVDLYIYIYIYIYIYVGHSL